MLVGIKTQMLMLVGTEGHWLVIRHLVTPSYCTWDSPVDTVQLRIYDDAFDYEHLLCIPVFSSVHALSSLMFVLYICFRFRLGCSCICDKIQEIVFIPAFSGGMRICVCVTTHLPSVTVIIITQCLFKRYDNH